MDFFEWIPLSKVVLGNMVAGGLGGVVRWIKLRERFLDGCASVFTGVICSAYLTPLITPLIKPLMDPDHGSQEKIERIAAFLVGLTAVVIVGFFIDVTKEWLQKIYQYRKK